MSYSLRSKTDSIMNLIQDPLQCLVPALMSTLDDGTRYLWSKKDIEYMNSFVLKNIQVQMKEVWIDMKKIRDEGTYNSWMIDTVAAAKDNVRRLKDGIEEGIQVRYYGATGTVDGLIDKAKICMEVPACVKEECWGYLVEVYDVVLEDLEGLIPQNGLPSDS